MYTMYIVIFLDSIELFLCKSGIDMLISTFLISIGLSCQSLKRPKLRDIIIRSTYIFGAIHFRISLNVR